MLAEFQSCLYCWKYPSNPQIYMHNPSTTASSGKNIAGSTSAQLSPLNEWKSSFQSLYLLWNAGHVDDFFYEGDAFTVLFKRLAESNEFQATLSKSSPFLRKELCDAGEAVGCKIVFINQLGIELLWNGDEEIYTNKSHHMSTQAIKMPSISGAVILHGRNCVHALFDLLINTRVIHRANGQLQSGDATGESALPNLLSSHVFLEASLKRMEVAKHVYFANQCR